MIMMAFLLSVLRASVQVLLVLYVVFVILPLLVPPFAAFALVAWLTWWALPRAWRSSSEKEETRP
jgi:hypothetical protein